MKRTEIIEKIIAYFAENDDIFTRCVEELDDWNGYLGDDRWQNMEYIDDVFAGESPSYILARAYCGGDKFGGEFRPQAEYFNFDGYGNLVSSDYCDYGDYNDVDTVEQLAEYREEIDAIGDEWELEQLFDKLENAEDEEEED